jgi:hypothetical protein
VQRQQGRCLLMRLKTAASIGHDPAAWLAAADLCLPFGGVTCHAWHAGICLNPQLQTIATAASCAAATNPAPLSQPCLSSQTARCW